MKTKYKIITGGNAAELEAKVNREVRAGKWQLQGGVVAIEYPNAKDADLIQTLWAQALVANIETIEAPPGRLTVQDAVRMADSSVA